MRFALLAYAVCGRVGSWVVLTPWWRTVKRWAMRSDDISASADADSTKMFSFASLAWFALGLVVLRSLAVLAWMFFPPTGIFPQIARVAIPLAVAVGLLMLNRSFLRRDGFKPDALGLAPSRFGWFWAGGVAMALVILAMAGGLWILVPYHWERGSMTWTQLAWQASEFSAGNAGEELAFRGYLLLALARRLGLGRALAIVAVLFGLFHLPGLSGWEALKMVCTTATMSFLFAYAFVLTGSLWAAVGAHVLGNVALHNLLGMSGGSSIATPVLHGPWPSAYDPAFSVWLAVGIAVAVGGFILTKRIGQRGVWADLDPRGKLATKELADQP